MRRAIKIQLLIFAQALLLAIPMITVANESGKPNSELRETLSYNILVYVYWYEKIGGAEWSMDYFNNSLPTILAAKGHTVAVVDRTVEPTLNANLLSGYDQLWLFTTQFGSSPDLFSMSEIDDILDFRNQGKGIFLMTDDENYHPVANQLSEQLNVHFYGNINNRYPAFPVSNQSHPLLDGVHSLTGDSEGRMTVTAPAELILEDNYGEIIAVLDDDYGKVVFDVSFAKAYDFRAYEEDNAIYFANVARWLDRYNELVGHWPFDESFGFFVEDVSGKGNHGSATGTSIVAGCDNNARYYISTSDYITIPHSQDFIMNGDFSVSVVIMLNQNPTSEQKIFTKYSSLSSTTGFEMSVGEDGHVYFQLGDPISNKAISSISLSPEVCYCIVGVRRGDQMYIYVRGQEEGFSSCVTYALSDPSDIIIGKSGPGSDKNFSGIIDDFRLYSYALAEEEIIGLYRKCCFICGDVDNDGIINILDIVYLINYIYKDGPVPVCWPINSCSDANSDELINILDIVYLINYIYKNGPAPTCL